MVSAAHLPGSSEARRIALRRVAPGRLAAILLVFVAIGPIVGTIVLALLIALTSGSLAAADSALVMVFLGLVSGLSHVIGGIPAAIAGLAVGIKQVRFGGAGWRFALIAGMLVGLAPLIFAHPSTTREAMNAAAIGTLVGYMIITTLSTLACWSIVRSWWLVRAGSAA
jgi:hypothetical protein